MWRGYHKLGSDDAFTRIAAAVPSSGAGAASSPAGPLPSACVDGKFAVVCDGAVDPAVCEEILARGEAAGYTDALLNTGDGRQEVGELNTQSRRSQRHTFHDTALAGRLWTLVCPWVPSADVVPGTRYHGRWVACGVNPCLRILKYDRDDHFELHQDGSYLAPADGAQGSPATRSFLTLQVYLNTGGGQDFAGGATRFYGNVSPGTLADGDVMAGLCVHDVVPRTGRVLVFQHNIWHSGERVSDGTKYVLRSEIMYEEVWGRQPPS
jgi:2OG-Fe(II) oxygenase superfamily